MAATMAAAVFDGRLRYVTDHPVPEKKPGWALIHVHTAGICKTDMELMHGYMEFRGVLGHEFIGIVEESDDPAWTGRRVAGEIAASIVTSALGAVAYFFPTPPRPLRDKASITVRSFAASLKLKPMLQHWRV